MTFSTVVKTPLFKVTLPLLLETVPLPLRTSVACLMELSGTIGTFAMDRVLDCFAKAGH